MIPENCDSLLEIQFFTELEEFICNTYVTYDMYWNMWLLGTYFKVFTGEYDSYTCKHKK